MYEIQFTRISAAPSAGEEQVNDCLVSQLVEELRSRWRQGMRSPVEEFLRRYPQVAQEPARALELIYEEWCLRQRYGPPPSVAELFARFPQWRAQLDILLRCHELLGEESLTEPTASAVPQAGEILAGFELVQELGRGARGCVFRARELSLAGRQVVLKILPSDDQEHFCLARLQHSHIVPLYAVYEEPSRRLRLLCLPYLGGTTLARLLQDLARLPPAARRGQDLLTALDRVSGSEAPAQAAGRRFLATATYEQAICWIGACLAEALHYAHERGLVHLDVKPSNILLAADGQPLLLDFHLAQPPILCAGVRRERLGGTPGYLSPEQEQALAAVRQQQPVPRPVDARSDIYSLGLVLYEALAGQLPDRTEGGRHGKRSLRHLSPALVALLHRCLESEPAARYPDAAALAADLRRHVQHLPLCGVPNRSWRERWRKWRRRHPQALPLGQLLLAVALVFAALGVVTWEHFRGQRQQAEYLLSQGQQLRQCSQPAPAWVLLQQARALLADLPGAARLEEQLRQEQQQTQVLLAQQVREYLQQAQQALCRDDPLLAGWLLRRGEALGQVAPLSPDLEPVLRQCQQHLLQAQLHQQLQHWRDYLTTRLATLEESPAPFGPQEEERCRFFWERRQLLLSTAWLPPAQARAQRYALLDLVLLWAAAQEGSRPRGQEAAWKLLHQAEDVLGPHRALSWERQRLATALGRQPEAVQAQQRALSLPLTSAWDCYLLGRACWRAGDWSAASVALQEASRQQPDLPEPYLFAGLCAYRQQRFAQAVSALSRYLALRPQSGPAYYYRGRALIRLGCLAAARRDFDQARKQEPTRAAAAWRPDSLHEK